MNTPILYSFRRCPYAMRARLAIKAAGALVYLREIVLKAKPDELKKASSKATVPVLCLPDGSVIDESLDVMRWALGSEWLTPKVQALIAKNDGDFKKALDGYKYPERYLEQSRLAYRKEGESFLAVLDDWLSGSAFLSGDEMGPLDWAILPFVRQFAGVDAAWFDALPYARLHNCLSGLIASDLFTSVMVRHHSWQAVDVDVVF